MTRDGIPTPIHLPQSIIAAAMEGTMPLRLGHTVIARVQEGQKIMVEGRNTMPRRVLALHWLEVLLEVRPALAVRKATVADFV